MTKFVIKVGNEFMTTGEPGSFSLVDKMRDAFAFETYEDAKLTASSMMKDGWQIVSVDESVFTMSITIH